MTVSRQETTAILIDLAGGDCGAVHRLMPLVYEELHSLAEGVFHRWQPGQTLQPTALVHEAYLRMVDRPKAAYRGRAHFMAVAAMAMRQILIDGARRRASEKRGGGRQRVAMHPSVTLTTAPDVDLLDLGEALEELTRLDERKAKVVELRFFGGLSIEETAEALGVARSTVADDWRLARAWLACRLGGPPAGEDAS